MREWVARWGLVALAVVAGLGVACGGEAAAAVSVRAVASTSIVADWVQEVGGERVEVRALLPAAADPHTFQPGARDVARVADADVVFSVGLGLEGAWLRELLRNAAAGPSKVVVLGDAVDAVPVGEGEGDAHGAVDPHFWFDPLRVKVAVGEIAARLVEADPEGRDVYLRDADAYARELDELHAWIEGQVETIPPVRRVLVTSHDSLGYFARRYGFRVVGAVTPGVTTEREPSAAELVRLVTEIRDRGVPAMFTETSVSDRLVRRIAEEVGVGVVRSLYTGSLGEPGSGADTYIGMMRRDVEIIVEALR